LLQCPASAGGITKKVSFDFLFALVFYVATIVLADKQSEAELTPLVERFSQERSYEDDRDNCDDDGACRCRMLVPIMKGWRVCLGRMDFPD